MLRIQQGVFHKKERVVIIFEGFDAAGKGGAIRNITEMLDPRGFRVHPIGAPTKEEQGKHWLYRFWINLPEAGNIAIFDRSWYGRVMVEKVDNLTHKEKIKESYDEINKFEETLQKDGIKVVKIFLAISKDEQLKRFQDRLDDPYKQWKISMDDINARKSWDQYVKAIDIILKKCNSKACPWLVIPANSKKHARLASLTYITNELSNFEKWMENAALTYETKKLKALLRKL
jgi:polyphosphate kinase 2 (PPK2 family)